MHNLVWLNANDNPTFPSTTRALDEPNGLLALGGQLTTDWLLEAYQHGIFPWFSEHEPIMWWSPAPRMVLEPGTAHVSRSLRKEYRRVNIEITTNRHFNAVIDLCADLRAEGTWITVDMKNAYIELHKQGWAHSVEVWCEKQLIGGLYGLGIGTVFFGESMFSLRPNASKYAFISLSEWARQNQLTMIDCQLHNHYLESLGAKLIGRNDFESRLPVSRKQLSLVERPVLTEILNDVLS
ncbi:leucyl/phenylalanyl-tRNA--protein transferase [Reinekea sp. G2M2-21]|uniref:leucyl/phenylalanyl-tRNA--protein transferase n=1 Tax=Reinekea sp. G2M2-21 TaxID=2788942 RepID=UPI0018A9892A|nr:leucyl/phenylalanyl-tRNA--protein transferase [Reinekea sp. G2M2-21]